jgi:MYXO-CTERM domain-containing protein
MLHPTRPRIIAALVVAAALGSPSVSHAQMSAKVGIVTTSLWIPDGVTTMRGVIAITGVGLGGGWPNNQQIRDMAKRLGIGVVTVRGEKSSGDDGSYPVRCMRGEFKMLLDSLTELGKVTNHPELANAPIIGAGHSHGGDYWNYFNACYPERMALIFCKSSGGVQYTKGALRTPMVWEIGTNDLNNSRGDFRGGMFAHRSKGQQLTLVLGPGETHGQLQPASLAMVVEIIEALFALRVPSTADPSKGPVTLVDIEEDKGSYWLGDNYSRQIGAYATFPGKMALQKTSFLPSEELAKKWSMAGANLPASIQIDDGFCSKCYKQLADEAPLKPANPGTGTPPASDAGAAPPPPPPMTAADASAGGTPPPVNPGPKLDAAPVEPPPPPPAPVPTPRQHKGGCAIGGADPAAAWLGLLALALLRARRRR